MYRLAIVIAVLVLGHASAADAQRNRREIVAQIHEKITNNLTQYKQELQNKSLAGCINWENSSPERIDVRHFFYFYTSISSDREFLPSDLMRSAKNRCNTLRKKHGSRCQCVSIDRGGKPALKVPDSFIEKVRDSASP